MERASQRCRCGHARSAHHYSKRTKRWLWCKRTVGRTGSLPNHQWCECKEFALA